MTNVHISWQDTVDPQACRTNPNVYDNYSRDPERTPFQWSFGKNSGFSTAKKTWLPLATNYSSCNVALQTLQKRSFLKNFRDLTKLRQNQSMKYGGVKLVPIDTEIMVYKRSIENDSKADVIVVILNLEGSYKTVDLSAHLEDLPAKMEVAVASVHSEKLVKG